MLKNMALKRITACSLVMMHDAFLVITKVGMQELTVYDFVIRRLIILGRVFFQNVLSSIFFKISTLSIFSYLDISSRN